MYDLILAVCAFALFAVLLGGIASAAKNGPGDVLLLFSVVTALFFGLRPLILLLGLDRPFPDYLFLESEVNGVIARTLLGGSLFLMFVIAGLVLVSSSTKRGWAPFFVPSPPDPRRMVVATLVLTGIAGLISAALLARYGSVGGLIAAAKQEKDLAGMFILRVFPAVGAVTALASFLEMRGRGIGVGRWWLLAASLLNAWFVFLWGSRSVFVVVAALLVFGLGKATKVSSTTLLRIVLAAVLVLAAASGLRVVRDTLAQGEVQEVYATASPARQFTLGVNAVQFDAAMLAFRDWPADYRYRRGEDFAAGALGVIPRRLWTDKPEGIAPGKWFRQVYEPGKVNGWPMGSTAIWYLNFGWPGIAFGGFVSGALLGAIWRRQSISPAGGWNLAVAMVTSVYVLDSGVHSESLVRFVVWLVPLTVIAKYISPRGSPQSDAQPAPPSLRMYS